MGGWVAFWGGGGGGGVIDRVCDFLREDEMLQVGLCGGKGGGGGQRRGIGRGGGGCVMVLGGECWGIQGLYDFLSEEEMLQGAEEDKGYRAWLWGVDWVARGAGGGGGRGAAWGLGKLGGQWGHEWLFLA